MLVRKYGNVDLNLLEAVSSWTHTCEFLSYLTFLGCGCLVLPRQNLFFEGFNFMVFNNAFDIKSLCLAAVGISTV
jgi:hypothetical protein